MKSLRKLFVFFLIMAPMLNTSRAEIYEAGTKVRLSRCRFKLQYRAEAPYQKLLTLHRLIMIVADKI